MNYRLILASVSLSLLAASVGGPAMAHWTTSASKDEMTGQLNHYAQSQSVCAQKRMSFPYAGTKAWLAIGCDGKTEWAYIGFTVSPNLLSTSNAYGHEWVAARIRWDDYVEDVTLTHEYGSTFLHFTNDPVAIIRIAQANSALLEVNWYGQWRTCFRFSLRGSSAAIRKMRLACAGQ